jgi:cytochrome oxidase Cu insertion factor (SCO1/SenC/PrrC family)
MLPLWVPALQIGQSIPTDVRLIDQDSHVRTWTSFRGNALVVGFIYTRCPDPTECSAISSKFAQMQGILPPHTHLIEITLDPTRDRPIVLRRYAASFGENPSRWTLLTGDPNTVLTLTRRFGISSSQRPNGEIEHTEAIAILDSRERLASLTVGSSWQPREVLAEVRAVNGQPNNVFERVALWFHNFGTTCAALLSENPLWRDLEIACAAVAAALVTCVSAALLGQLRSPAHAPCMKEDKKNG